MLCNAFDFFFLKWHLNYWLTVRISFENVVMLTRFWNTCLVGLLECVILPLSNYLNFRYLILLSFYNCCVNYLSLKMYLICPLGPLKCAIFFLLFFWHFWGCIVSGAGDVDSTTRVTLRTKILIFHESEREKSS